MHYHADFVEDFVPRGEMSWFTLYNIGILLPREKQALIPEDQHSITSLSLCGARTSTNNSIDKQLLLRNTSLSKDQGKETRNKPTLCRI